VLRHSNDFHPIDQQQPNINSMGSDHQELQADSQEVTEKRWLITPGSPTGKHREPAAHRPCPEGTPAMSLLRHPAPAAKFVGLANPIGYAAQMLHVGGPRQSATRRHHRHRAELGLPVSAAT
jgi:hypothetical protein